MTFAENQTVIDLINRGDEQAMKFLFTTFYPRLYGYAIKFVKDDEAAKDLVQECFIRLYERHGALKDISLNSMLFTMVRNLCLNYMKHELIMKKHISDTLQKYPGEKLYNEDFEYERSSDMIIEELEHNIEIAINNMPEMTKTIFIMSREQKLKQKEISELTGMSLYNVNKHLKLAMATIKQQLDIS